MRERSSSVQRMEKDLSSADQHAAQVDVYITKSTKRKVKPRSCDDGHCLVPITIHAGNDSVRRVDSHVRQWKISMWYFEPHLGKRYTLVVHSNSMDAGY